MRMQLSTHHYALEEPFRISRGTITAISAIRVTVAEDGTEGRGEAVGLAYRGESVETMLKQLESLRDGCGLIERDRNLLSQRLPAGGARNALDCALWDWEAKAENARAWELASLSAPSPIGVTATLSLNDPEAMARAALEAPPYTALKVKLGDARGDLDRLAAIRAAVPTSRLLIDANGGWDFATLQAFTPTLLASAVELIEQPLARGADDALNDWVSPIPLCADESCDETADISTLPSGYSMINIKLDKAGGLTEALRMRAAAHERGLTYMLGCMIESSLGLAPATLLADGAVWCDLDGPRLLSNDIEPRLIFAGEWLTPSGPSLWG